MLNHRWFSKSLVLISLLTVSMIWVCCERKSSPNQPTAGAPTQQTPTSETVPPATKKPTELVIAGPNNISMLPMVAASRSLLPPGSIFKPVQSGKLAMDGVIAGDITVGVVVDTNIAYVGFRPEVDLVVIASVMTKTDDALVVRSDQIKMPADLVGKTIAYVPATTSDSFLWRFLKHHGIGADQVKLLGSTPPAIPPAMVSSEIGAASIWEPWRSNAREKLKENAGEFANDGVYTAYVLFAVRRSTLAERPEELRALLRSMIESEMWIDKNPDEARKIIAAEIPMSTDALKASWSQYSPKVRLPKALVPSLAEEGEHVRTTQDGFRGKPLPNYANFVDAGLLREVSRERVDGP